MSQQPEDKTLVATIYKDGQILAKHVVVDMRKLGFDYTPPSEPSFRNITRKNSRRSLKSF